MPVIIVKSNKFLGSFPSCHQSPWCCFNPSPFPTSNVIASFIFCQDRNDHNFEKKRNRWKICLLQLLMSYNQLNISQMSTKVWMKTKIQIKVRSSTTYIIRMASPQSPTRSPSRWLSFIVDFWSKSHWDIQYWWYNVVKDIIYCLLDE